MFLTVFLSQIPDTDRKKSVKNGKETAVVNSATGSGEADEAVVISGAQGSEVAQKEVGQAEK